MPFHHLLPERYRGPNARVPATPDLVARRPPPSSPGPPTGKWMRALSERLETWVHLQGEPDLDAIEAPMEPELAERIYELDRCIECGCCIAACGMAQMRQDFVGAAGLNKIARFRLDPRDRREEADYYGVIGDDQGVFGCMSLLGCHDVCPKGLSLQTQIAYLRCPWCARA